MGLRGTASVHGGRWSVPHLLRAAVVCVLAAGSAPAAAQSARPADSVTVSAGAEYASPPLSTSLVGSSYRDLWAAPIRVEVLDPDREKGGLNFLRLGGGRQTTSVRFTDSKGREYVFRSVNKYPLRTEDAELSGSLGGRVLADQVSSMVPAAPLVAARLAEAAGVLHARPRLVVMPDHPGLGEARESFSGMLGTFEEHPDEVDDDTPGFGGFERVAGSESFLENLTEDPRHRVDARAYLMARLLDLVLGDWDRHDDQWRWARESFGELRVWKPIARDRDYALSDYDGLLIRLARSMFPSAGRFTPDLDQVDGLIRSSRALDARLLAELDRSAWDSVVVELQHRLTDDEIRAAVETLPAPYLALRGEAFVETLRARRDALPTAVNAFYNSVAQVAEIHGTEGDERALIHRAPDGRVLVRVESEFEGWQGTLFQREFRPEETREIRIFLEAGNDVATVEGAAGRGILVRIIGGDGDDVLTDGSGVTRRGIWTTLHDDGDRDRLRGNATTAIDRRTFVAPEFADDGPFDSEVPDYGRVRSYRPVVDYSTTRGLILGAGVTIINRAFRQDPYRTRLDLSARVAPKWPGFAVGLLGEKRSANPIWRAEFRADASSLDAFRFYGFGNETTATLSSATYLVRPDIFSGSAMLYRRLPAGFEAGAGPVARYIRYRAAEGSPFRTLHPGSGPKLMYGGLAVSLAREMSAFGSGPLQMGAFLSASAFPVVSDRRDAFGSLGATWIAATPITDDIRGRLRVGGRYAWGPYPVASAAFLGGRETLRGYPEWRFAGDGMVHASLESFVTLGRLDVIINWNVDAFGFYDVGRVFLAGEDSNDWHGAPGAGLAFTAFDYTLAISYAHGPDPRVYLDLGF